MKQGKNVGKVTRFYANECKVGVEIPMGLGFMIAISRNFGGVIPLIQMAFLEKNSYGLKFYIF
jgi:hypothetical protein